MSQQANLNVYRGSNAIRDYYDPDTATPLPLVEVPDHLNPYRQDGVRIYAKMMSMHPANNVKCMPGKVAHSLELRLKLSEKRSVKLA